MVESTPIKINDVYQYVLRYLDDRELDDGKRFPSLSWYSTLEEGYAPEEVKEHQAIIAALNAAIQARLLRSDIDGDTVGKDEAFLAASRRRGLSLEMVTQAIDKAVESALQHLQKEAARSGRKAGGGRERG